MIEVKAQHAQPSAELSRDVVLGAVGGEPSLLREFQLELQDSGQVDAATCIGGIKSQHRFSSIEKAHDVDPGAHAGLVKTVDGCMRVVAKTRVAFDHESR